MAQTLLFKVAAECNLRCTYCYWFAEPSVATASKVSHEAVVTQFVRRLDEYLSTPDGEAGLNISLHGGEPLLLGKKRFAQLCLQITESAQRHARDVSISCQTNGMLIDEEWVSIFRYFGVNVGVSIDGPKEVHDERRVGKRGRGSFDLSVRGYRLLQSAELDPGLLAVWGPMAEADELVDFFTNELSATHFDVLLPDSTFDQPQPRVDTFYNRLFDIWFDDLIDRRVNVRICNSLLRSTLGHSSGMESIGLGAVATAGVNSAGGYELLDVLNIAGVGLASVDLNVFDASFAELFASSSYQTQLVASTSLCTKCDSCRFRQSCGGGYLPARWSSANGFNNPSAHCESLFSMFTHVHDRVSARINWLLQRPEMVDQH
jgi:uncharacterized protein